MPRPPRDLPRHWRFAAALAPLPHPSWNAEPRPADRAAAVTASDFWRRVGV